MSGKGSKDKKADGKLNTNTSKTDDEISGKKQELSLSVDPESLLKDYISRLGKSPVRTTNSRVLPQTVTPSKKEKKVKRKRLEDKTEGDDVSNTKITKKSDTGVSNEKQESNISLDADSLLKEYMSRVEKKVDDSSKSHDSSKIASSQSNRKLMKKTDVTTKKTKIKKNERKSLRVKRKEKDISDLHKDKKCDKLDANISNETEETDISVDPYSLLQKFMSQSGMNEHGKGDDLGTPKTEAVHNRKEKNDSTNKAHPKMKEKEINKPDNIGIAKDNVPDSCDENDGNFNDKRRDNDVTVDTSSLFEKFISQIDENKDKKMDNESLLKVAVAGSTENEDTTDKKHHKKKEHKRKRLTDDKMEGHDTTEFDVNVGSGTKKKKVSLSANTDSLLENSMLRNDDNAVKKIDTISDKGKETDKLNNKEKKESQSNNMVTSQDTAESNSYTNIVNDTNSKDDTNISAQVSSLLADFLLQLNKNKSSVSNEQSSSASAGHKEEPVKEKVSTTDKIQYSKKRKKKNKSDDMTVGQDTPNSNVAKESDLGDNHTTTKQTKTDERVDINLFVKYLLSRIGRNEDVASDHNGTSKMDDVDSKEKKNLTVKKHHDKKQHKEKGSKNEIAQQVIAESNVDDNERRESSLLQDSMLHINKNKDNIMDGEDKLEIDADHNEEKSQMKKESSIVEKGHNSQKRKKEKSSSMAKKRIKLNAAKECNIADVSSNNEKQETNITVDTDILLKDFMSHINKNKDDIMDEQDRLKIDAGHNKEKSQLKKGSSTVEKRHNSPKKTKKKSSSMAMKRVKLNAAKESDVVDVGSNNEKQETNITIDTDALLKDFISRHNRNVDNKSNTRSPLKVDEVNNEGKEGNLTEKRDSKKKHHKKKKTEEKTKETVTEFSVRKESGKAESKLTNEKQETDITINTDFLLKNFISNISKNNDDKSNVGGVSKMSTTESNVKVREKKHKRKKLETKSTGQTANLNSNNDSTLDKNVNKKTEVSIPSTTDTLVQINENENEKNDRKLNSAHSEEKAVVEDVNMHEESFSKKPRKKVTFADSVIADQKSDFIDEHVTESKEEADILDTSAIFKDFLSRFSNYLDDDDDDDDGDNGHSPSGADSDYNKERKSRKEEVNAVGKQHTKMQLRRRKSKDETVNKGADLTADIFDSRNEQGPINKHKTDGSANATEEPNLVSQSEISESNLSPLMMMDKLLSGKEANSSHEVHVKKMKKTKRSKDKIATTAMSLEDEDKAACEGDHNILDTHKHSKEKPEGKDDIKLNDSDKPGITSDNINDKKETNLSIDTDSLLKEFMSKVGRNKNTESDSPHVMPGSKKSSVRGSVEDGADLIRKNHKNKEKQNKLRDKAVEHISDLSDTEPEMSGSKKSNIRGMSSVEDGADLIGKNHKNKEKQNKLRDKAVAHNISDLSDTEPEMPGSKKSNIRGMSSVEDGADLIRKNHKNKEKQNKLRDKAVEHNISDLSDTEPEISGDNTDKLNADKEAGKLNNNCNVEKQGTELSVDASALLKDFISHIGNSNDSQNQTEVDIAYNKDKPSSEVESRINTLISPKNQHKKKRSKGKNVVEDNGSDTQEASETAATRNNGETGLESVNTSQTELEDLNLSHGKRHKRKKSKDKATVQRDLSKEFDISLREEEVDVPSESLLDIDRYENDNISKVDSGELSVEKDVDTSGRLHDGKKKKRKSKEKHEETQHGSTSYNPKEETLSNFIGRSKNYRKNLTEMDIVHSKDKLTTEDESRINNLVSPKKQHKKKRSKGTTVMQDDETDIQEPSVTAGTKNEESESEDVNTSHTDLEDINSSQTELEDLNISHVFSMSRVKRQKKKKSKGKASLQRELSKESDAVNEHFNIREEEIDMPASDSLLDIDRYENDNILSKMDTNHSEKLSVEKDVDSSERLHARKKKKKKKSKEKHDNAIFTQQGSTSNNLEEETLSNCIGGKSQIVVDKKRVSTPTFSRSPLVLGGSCMADALDRKHKKLNRGGGEAMPRRRSLPILQSSRFKEETPKLDKQEIKKRNSISNFGFTVSPLNKKSDNLKLLNLKLSHNTSNRRR
ncbi:titin homolog [Periplaneta americana]|uniref:titin homolog n=1 Tax=Periplaneta americana TaxID=6978 RepID=UPI0037E887B4